MVWDKQILRAEESPLGREHGHKDIVHLGHLTHELRQAEIQILGHGIELLFVAQSDDGHLAANLKGHSGFWVDVGHYVSVCVSVRVLMAI
jgi:hypothetical protein